MKIINGFIQHFLVFYVYIYMTTMQTVLDDIDNIKQSVVMRMVDGDITKKYGSYITGRLDDISYKISKIKNI